MADKSVAIALVIIFVLFFLSVIAPMKSQNKFWRLIHKIRNGMDFVVYWFFNLCAILQLYMWFGWEYMVGWQYITFRFVGINNIYENKIGGNIL